MGTVFRHGLMGLDMKVSGKIIKFMGRASFNMWTGIFLRENCS